MIVELLIKLFVLIHAILFVWIVINSLFLPSLKQKRNQFVHPSVSILIPLRNEARNVKPLVESLKKLDYPSLSFYFLDDDSTDQTYDLLFNETKGLQNSVILKGQELPNSWTGKVFACHQLSQAVRDSELYCFIDADVRLTSSSIRQAVQLLKKENAGLLTGFPAFPVTSLLSKLLVPMQHFVVFLHLPIFLANRSTFPAATAAHGAFMLFDRLSYLEAGGHEAVKSSLVEDVQLAMLMKKKGANVILTNITSFVTCHMYETNQEVWNGFKKNIFNGLGRSILLSLFIILFYFLFYLVPFVFPFLTGFTSIGAYLPILFIFLQRLLVDVVTKQKAWLFIMMPFSSFMLICLLFEAMRAYFFGAGYEWKQRIYRK
ncbi:glycosyltransferase [Bacillus sp. DJP31]|uniref:glycosyltransferase n=1 Tax=Bacillus sp. DJP31 TaxID=3409789 RepID=UPI003BB48E98